jgi:hypothetical protein
MKTKIKLFFITLLLPLLSIAHAPVGYHVFYQTGKKLEQVKTTELVEVLTLAQLIIPGNCIDIAKGLTKQPFFYAEFSGRTFYVEIKKINKRGKYRRMSMREFKQLQKAKP